MSKASALNRIDKALGIDGERGSSDYEALKSGMADWFSGNELDQFAEHLEDENNDDDDDDDDNDNDDDYLDYNN